MRRLATSMLTIVLLALVLVGTGCAATSAPDASPNTPSSVELVERPQRYDDVTITFEGEAIGEAMVRGEHAWIHVNDDAYHLRNTEEGAPLGGYNSGMAIWVTVRDAERIRTFGDYGHEGDIVRVEGVFHAVCGEHGGDMDIHANSLEVVRRGHRVVDTVKPAKVVWAAVLSVIAGALYVISRNQLRWSEAA